LITTATAEWILLSVIYHYVLERSPSPEAAKFAISEARRNGQLRLRAKSREHKARPHLRLKPGKLPPKSLSRCKSDQLILASDKFSTWDWERSYATMRDESTKSLFEYMEIVGYRDDVLKLWPPVETAATPERAETAETAIVLTLDNIEKERPTGLTGFTQDQLTKKVNARARRAVSKRTLQKALIARRKRNGRV
jgi:hypothetical protein